MTKEEELQKKTYACYQAFTSSVRLSQDKRDKLKMEWEVAHRAWWDEVQRVLGKETAGERELREALDEASKL